MVHSEPPVASAVSNRTGLAPAGGVTGIFWAAPAADLLAIAITGVVMVRLWRELSVPDKDAVAEKVLPKYPAKTASASA